MKSRGKGSAQSMWRTMGGHIGATTTTDTVAARVEGCTGSTRGAGHAGGGDTPAATGGGIAEAAEDPAGGGDAGAGSVGGTTTTRPLQAHPSCLEPRKSPAQGIIPAQGMSREATTPFHVDV